MKNTIVTFANAKEYKPEHPERTTKKPSGEWDVVFREWPSREVMLKALQHQGTHTPQNERWIPLV